MIVAALIVLLIAVLALLAGIFGGTHPALLDLGSYDLKTDATAIFVLGMATLLLFVLGLGMLRVGVRRASRHRKERKRVGRLSSELDGYKKRERSRSDSTDVADREPTEHDSDHQA